MALWLWGLLQQFQLVQLRAGSPLVAPVDLPHQVQPALKARRVVEDQPLGDLAVQHHRVVVLAAEALQLLLRPAAAGQPRQVAVRVLPALVPVLLLVRQELRGAQEALLAVARPLRGVVRPLRVLALLV